MFPTNLPVASFDPTPAQRSALAYLQSGQPRFANPLTQDINNIKASLQNPGGFPLGDIAALQTTMTSLIPPSVNGADAINTQIQQYMGTELFNMNQLFNQYKLTSLLDVAPHIESVLEPTLAIQTARIVDTLPQTVSMVSSYSVSKANFSDRVKTGQATDPTTGSLVDVYGPSYSSCDAMKNVLGSLGGAADAFVGEMNSAISNVSSVFSNASSSAIATLNSTMTEISVAAAAIQADIAAWVSNGSNMFTPPNLALFDDLKSKLGSLNSDITNVMSSAANAMGQTVEALSSSLAAGADSIKSHAQNICDMVTAELSELNHVISYITDVGIVCSLPNLSICGKEVASRLSGAAGADEIKQLVA